MSETYTRLEIMRWLLEEPGKNMSRHVSSDEIYYRLNCFGVAEILDDRGYWTETEMPKGSHGWRKVEPKKTREEALKEICLKHQYEATLQDGTYSALICDICDYLITEALEAK